MSFDAKTVIFWQSQIDAALEKIDDVLLIEAIERIVPCQDNFLKGSDRNAEERRVDIESFSRTIKGRTIFNRQRLCGFLISPSSNWFQCTKSHAQSVVDSSTSDDDNGITGWQELLKVLRTIEEYVDHSNGDPKNKAQLWACNKLDYEVVKSDSPISECAANLRRFRVLVVINDQRLAIGVITQTDLQRMTSQTLIADHISTKQPVCFPDDEPMKNVYDRLQKRDIDHVVIYNKSDGTFFGVVSYVECLRWYSGSQPEPCP